MNIRPATSTPALLACLLAAILPASTLAQSSTERVPESTPANAQPADPEAGAIPVTEEFRFPRANATDETTSGICQVLVSETGQVLASKCGQSGGSDRFRGWIRNELYYRLERARFRPAMVNDVPVSVSMALRLVASCTGKSDCEVSVYPNSGMHGDTFGPDYYSPQEIVDESGTWYDRLLETAACAGGEATVCKDLGAFAFSAGVKVGEAGLTVGVGLPADQGKGEFPGEQALQRLIESRFIPAQNAQGERMEMLVFTPTLHSPKNPHFERSECLEETVIGQRLPAKRCYTLQAFASLYPDQASGWGDGINFWVRQ